MGVGLGVGEGDGDGDGVAPGGRVGAGEGEGDGVGDGLGVGVGMGVCEGPGWIATAAGFMTGAREEAVSMSEPPKRSPMIGVTNVNGWDAVTTT